MSTITSTQRVAIYRSSLLPISETFIREQAKALPNWRPVLIGRQKFADGLDLSKLSVEITPKSDWLAPHSVYYLLQRPQPNLVQQLKRLGISLVHVHFGTEATDIWPSVKATGLPMLVTLHGYDINTHRWWWESGRGGLRRLMYPRQLLRMAQSPLVHFVAVSQSIKRRAINYGIPSDKITVCYIGVDTERFYPGGRPLNQRRNRILYVGRMVEKKAPLLMIRAFAALHNQVPDAELVMIGTGPQLEFARQLAQSLNVPVDFLGARSSDDVLTQMHQARVFCLPSVVATNGDAEGLPISILEAMACGIPVITSAFSAADEIITHQKNGLCFKENDVNELSDNIKSVISNENYLLSLSAAARIRAKEIFSISKNIKHLEDIYSSHVKNNFNT
ncbi:MAG: glycosyltransferase [Ottowia sp.]|uniref:glycosyltransferase n=1 Tax=Ottowia sp. TaxID=1898956 RepID=UPI003C749F00